MATETSNDWAKRASGEESSERASGGGGGGDDASKKHNDVVGGKSGEEVVSWASFGRSMTSIELLQHFECVIENTQLNSPIPDNCKWAKTLLDLVKNGHPDPKKVIGCGIESFQVERDEMCSHRHTFFIVRKDGSRAKFCFRTCIDNVLPLPEHVKVHPSGLVAVCLCHLGELIAVRAARTAITRREVVEGATSFTLGPVKFRDSSHMYTYFCLLMFSSPLNEALNEDAHLLLLELLKKGDPDSEKKIGSGFECFQVRIHPAYDSGLRSFYLVRGDGSAEDFCYIKCVDNIVPLTEGLRETSAGPCSCHHKEDGDGVVTLGYRIFQTSVEMVEYFKLFFRDISLDTPIVCEVTRFLLFELLKKGDPEWEEKKVRSGSGKVQSFQIKECPNTWKRRSLVVVWENGSVESFCVMTCIDNIFPLPKEYKCFSANSRKRGGRGRGHCGGGGCKSGTGKRNKKRRL